MNYVCREASLRKFLAQTRDAIDQARAMAIRTRQQVVEVRAAAAETRHRLEKSRAKLGQQTATWG